MRSLGKSSDSMNSTISELSHSIEDSTSLDSILHSMKESNKHRRISNLSPKPRILVCTHSNGAVDEFFYPQKTKATMSSTFTCPNCNTNDDITTDKQEIAKCKSCFFELYYCNFCKKWLLLSKLRKGNNGDKVCYECPSVIDLGEVNSLAGYSDSQSTQVSSDIVKAFTTYLTSNIAPRGGTSNRVTEIQTENIPQLTKLKDNWKKCIEQPEIRAMMCSTESSSERVDSLEYLWQQIELNFGYYWTRTTQIQVPNDDDDEKKKQKNQSVNIKCLIIFLSINFIERKFSKNLSNQIIANICKDFRIGNRYKSFIAANQVLFTKEKDDETKLLSALETCLQTEYFVNNKNKSGNVRSSPNPFKKFQHFCIDIRRKLLDMVEFISNLKQEKGLSLSKPVILVSLCCIFCKFNDIPVQYSYLPSISSKQINISANTQTIINLSRKKKYQGVFTSFKKFDTVYSDHENTLRFNVEFMESGFMSPPLYTKYNGIHFQLDQNGNIINCSDMLNVKSRTHFTQFIKEYSNLDELVKITSVPYPVLINNSRVFLKCTINDSVYNFNEKISHQYAFKEDNVLDYIKTLKSFGIKGFSLKILFQILLSVKMALKYQQPLTINHQDSLFISTNFHSSLDQICNYIPFQKTVEGKYKTSMFGEPSNNFKVTKQQHYKMFESFKFLFFGNFELESLLILFCWKIMYPNQIYFIRCDEKCSEDLTKELLSCFKKDHSKNLKWLLEQIFELMSTSITLKNHVITLNKDIEEPVEYVISNTAPNNKKYKHKTIMGDTPTLFRFKGVELTPSVLSTAKRSLEEQQPTKTDNKKRFVNPKNFKLTITRKL